MKFAVATVAALLMANPSVAFVPSSPMQQRTSSARFMAMDLPPPQPAAVITQTSDLPVISSNPMGQPSGVRYSDFLKLVNADKIEKVTFSADGSQLLGVDVDGSRLKIDTLPNDPDLLAQLTSHKVWLLLVPMPRNRHVSNSLTIPPVSCTRLMLLYCQLRKQVVWVTSHNLLFSLLPFLRDSSS